MPWRLLARQGSSHVETGSERLPNLLVTGDDPDRLPVRTGPVPPAIR